MEGLASEKEVKRGLKVMSDLITIDGVDGAGSSVIAGALAGKLRQMGREVLLIEVPQQTIGYPKKVLENYFNQESRRVNLGYLTETKRVYQKQVRPALKTDMVVILVSSEVRNITHAVLDHNQEALMGPITKGTATGGLIAGTRVFVLAPPEEIVKVLQDRQSSGQLSQHDPMPQLVEVNKKIRAFKESMSMINKILPGSAFVEINNDRSQAPDEMAEEIMGQLNLSPN